MLIEHFKLGVQPFGVTPDARFLYLSHTHREAIASLLYGIHFGRGFAALIAAPGMGKTTLLFHVLGLIMGNARTAFLFQTLCGPEEFLRALLVDLGIEEEGGDIARMHAKLNAYLLEESKRGRQVVVVIDEAQNLDDRVLELVRMLSNFETPGKKLMHLVLSGQPQLAEKLSSEHLTQLRQRISIVARLAPLNAHEIRAYIEHRLRVAGAAPDKPLFSNQAYAMIAEQSGGIPRNINNLCFNSMSLACATKQPQVDASMVRETINDLDLTTIACPPNRPGVERLPCSSHCDRVAALPASWRYRRVFAIGFLISFVGLLAYLWVPPNLRNQATMNVSQQKTSRDSAVVSVASVLAPEGGQGPNYTEHKLPPQASSGAIPSGRLPQRKMHTHRNRQAVRTKSLAAHDDEGHTAADALELGPLPRDLEHSRMVELSLDQEILGKKQPETEKKTVPPDSAPQREKP